MSITIYMNAEDIANELDNKGEEVWRPAIYLQYSGKHLVIPNLEVSTWGNVKFSESYRITSKRGTEPAITTHAHNNGGKKQYLSANVGCSEGILRRLQVHRLVLSTFEPDAYQAGLEVHHIDNDPTNNHVSNLKWMSGKDNLAIRNGVSDE